MALSRISSKSSDSLHESQHNIERRERPTPSFPKHKNCTLKAIPPAFSVQFLCCKQCSIRTLMTDLGLFSMAIYRKIKALRKGPASTNGIGPDYLKCPESLPDKCGDDACLTTKCDCRHRGWNECCGALIECRGVSLGINDLGIALY